ncbi:MAG TPA: hypothetical protein PKG74_01255 [Candidatus Colwellbacteria bacterium]|nr:hypothetical protein [Candidatus Colwellbacteria bacterium]
MKFMDLSTGKTRIFLAVVGVLILSLAFGLGYFSGQSFCRNPIVIETCAD